MTTKLAFIFLTMIFSQVTIGAIHCAEATDKDMTETSFNLRIGDQKTLSDENLVLKFRAVLEDSRCPEGVTCFWEGNAAISLEMQSAAEPPRTVTLNTHGSPKMPHSAEAFGHVVKLDQLTPYPNQDKLIESTDYEATLTVNPIK